MLEQTDALDKAFNALADSTRRSIIDRLTRGPASVSELAAPFPFSLAAIQQHVQLLEASGLITTEKRGRVRECRISTDAIAQVEQWLSERRLLWEHRFDRLGKLLESQENDT